MIYKCKYFKIEELVPKSLFKQYEKETWKLWALFDDRILREADRLREQYGRCYINNWLWGGKLNNCGYREQNSGVGSNFSQHCFGRALDLHFVDWDIEEIRHSVITDCISNPKKYPIRGVELNVSWLHIDVRNRKELLTFSGK